MRVSETTAQLILSEIPGKNIIYNAFKMKKIDKLESNLIWVSMWTVSITNPKTNINPEG